MRYISIYRSTSREEGAMPDPAHMEAMGRLVQEMMEKGVLIGTEPLAPRAACARVELSNGEFIVSEEPERASGYAFLNASSLDEAIEHCKTFLKVAGDGVTEIRQVLEFGPPPQGGQ
jgi:hypothetical protein